MYKPRVAAVIGLICAVCVAAQIGISRSAGGQGAGGSATWQGQGAGTAASAGASPLFAQVPGSHAVYGWHYPYAFSWEPSQNQYREASESGNPTGSWR
jgi:hypothetical protein